VVRGILNRSEVEEIALRLERCFDEPFALEDLVISGAASIGVALFPQDAGSAATLLRAADAAMYVMKQSRHDGTETPPA
jgi:GGDEF domain-containing protein